MSGSVNSGPFAVPSIVSRPLEGEGFLYRSNIHAALECGFSFSYDTKCWTFFVMSMPSDMLTLTKNALVVVVL